MSSADTLLAQIEGSALATTIQGSTLLNGVLSGLHLVGLTLLLGSVLVTGAGLSGALGAYPVAEVTRAARRGSFVGLAISVSTGLLLLSPRVVAASENSTFRLKMALLCAAVLVQLAFQLPAARGRQAWLPPALAAVVTALLWVGVALAGCAFILLE